MSKKIYNIPKRSGGFAQVIFTKPANNSIWYWDLTDGSIPLPTVKLGNCKSLRACLKAVEKERGGDMSET